MKKKEKCPICGKSVQVLVCGYMWVGLWCGHTGPMASGEGPKWGEFKREDFPVMKPNSVEAKK